MKRRSKLKGKAFPYVETQRLDKNLTPLETVVLDVKADMSIGNDLVSELRDSAGLLAWYALLKEHAHEAMKQAKYRMHKRFEAKYDDIKAETPKMTETAVKNAVHRDSKWRRYTEKYMKWRYRYRMLNELCNAMTERNNNLRTLEASKRKERDQ